MREIVIKTVYREEGFHVVRLGNGTIHKFNSQKTAKKFLADTNRFLTGILFQLNQVQAELYTHGREIWIVSKEIREGDQVDPHLHSLEETLKRSYFRSSFAAGNYFTFIDMRKYCESAKGLIKFYQDLKHVRQTDTVRRHKLGILFDRIQAVQMQLLNYGQSDAWKFFDVEKAVPYDNLEYSRNQHLRIA